MLLRDGKMSTVLVLLLAGRISNVLLMAAWQEKYGVY